MTLVDTFTVPKTFAAGQLVTGPGFYNGGAHRETGGAARLAVRIWDSLSASGQLIDVFSCAANDGSWHEGFMVRFGIGLFVEVVTGTVEGAIYIA